MSHSHTDTDTTTATTTPSMSTTTPQTNRPASEILEPTSHTKTISEDDVIDFAEWTGDHNPLHLDEDAAEDTIFGGCVVHGMATFSLISTALEAIPGLVVLVGHDNVKYRLPVYPGEEVTARAFPLSIIEDDPEKGKRKVLCATAIRNGDGDVVIESETTILQFY